MKKHILSLLFLCISMVAFADQSGTCGNALTWTLTEADSTLTISGTGAMDYMSPTGSPWHQYKSNVAHIVVNEGVTTIGGFAFHTCLNLETVALPSTITTIENGAFYNCQMPSMTLPNGLQTIDDHAFEKSGLTTLVVPNSVTKIGASAFESCVRLTSITLSNGINRLEEKVFAYCWGLLSLDIPAGVTTIESQALYNCSKLRSVTIPNGVVDIAGRAFNACYVLDKIILPASVQNIGSRVFEDSPLLHVFCRGTVPPSADETAFGTEITSVATLHVPDNGTSVATYSAAPVWREFSRIVGDDGDGTAVENVTDKQQSKVVKIIEEGKIFILRNGVKYDLNGRQLQ